MNNLQSFLLFIHCTNGAVRRSARAGAGRTTLQSINIRTNSWQQEKEEVAAGMHEILSGFVHRSFRLRSSNRLISSLWGFIWSGNRTQASGAGVAPSGPSDRGWRPPVRVNLLHVDMETWSCENKATSYCALHAEVSHVWGVRS